MDIAHESDAKDNDANFAWLQHIILLLDRCFHELGYHQFLYPMLRLE